MQRCAQLQDYKLLVFANEYPGYSYQSPGELSTTEILHAAEVTTQHASDVAQRLGLPLVLIGSSLGTFSAARMASKGFGDSLLLHAPLTSMVDVASALYWYVPVDRFLSRDVRFEMLSDLPRVGARCASGELGALIIHGDADSIVPYASGRAVYEGLTAGSGGTKSDSVAFVTAVGKGHNNVDICASGPYGDTIAAFFRRGGEGTKK
jgi:pimeloyl-ACP methyl ester carboxylesterase